MRADSIPEIICSLDNGTMKYQCVMISGDWGIGKSYQLNAAIKDNKPVAYCSLFGVKNVSDVFGELVFRLTLNRKAPAVNLKNVSDSLDLGKFDSIKDTIGNLISSQMVFDCILNRREKRQETTLLIFDDVERISDNFDFDSLLGSVETLIQEHHTLKVIFVANLAQLSEKHKLIWDKYSEKVVDKIFYIDELAEHINIIENQEDNKFALDFMRKHGSKNLRTLKKANGFFEDVSRKIDGIDSTLLADTHKKHIVRIICYSITFEEVERIYEIEWENLSKEIDENEGKELTYLSIIRKNKYESIENRIYYKYLNEITVTEEIKMLVLELIKYFCKGNGNFNIISVSLAAVKENEKPIFYCSDSEVQEYIRRQRERIKKNDFANLYQFLKCVDEIFIWSKVQGEDTSDLIAILKDKAPVFYSSENRCGVSQWSVSVYYDYLQSGDLKEALSLLEDDLEIRRYQSVFHEFSEAINSKDYHTACNLIYDIQKIIQKPEFINAVGEDSLLKVMCSESLLPIGSCSEYQYNTATIAYAIGITVCREKYMGYLQNVLDKYPTDKMFIERMTQIKRACKDDG